MARYRLARVGVLDQDNGNALILPNYPGWGAYLNWLAAHNDPDPLVVPPHVVTPTEQAALDEIAAQNGIIATLKGDAAIQALRNRTPAQVDSWIDAQINSLADAKAVLKILARIVALLARQMLK